MAFSVGIGLTNECNLRCPHCYRPDMVVQRLTLRDVQQVCESLPARSVNLGVGENGLHAEYEAILDYLCARAQDEHHRSEEHTSELQSPCNLVCRLLLEKKKAASPPLADRPRAR